MTLFSRTFAQRSSVARIVVSESHTGPFVFPNGVKLVFPNGEWPVVDGVLPVDKPKGLTSFDVVRAVRRATGVKRVGHAGTLDPMATGLLVLLVGRGTKVSEQVMHWPKEYTGTIRLGEETASYDAETPVLRRVDASGVSEQNIRSATNRFVGTITQLTPAYSAVRINGERSYKKARRGEHVQRPPRIVTVTSLEITDVRESDVDFRLRCSAGTYVRAIAHDLGADLGVGGHLTALRRTKIGDLSAEGAWQLSDLEAAASAE